MVWKINDPYELTVSNILTDIPPVFDGKNVWVATTTGLSCIEFWGPYDDEDVYPNSTYTRWKDEEVDLLTYKNIPQKIRVIKTVVLPDITSILYHNGRLIISTLTRIRGLSCTTGVLSAGVPWPVGVVKNSNLAIHNNSIYFVEQLPTTQSINDSQNLWSVNNVTGVFAVVSQIPGKKQSAPRDLVIANEILYISSMNTREVHKFNANTGAYLTSIVINRDPEKLYRVDNDVMIISSMRGKSIINEVEYATSMVSKLTQTDTVDHLYGILTAGKFMADVGDYVWFVNDSGLLQRTKKIDNKTFLSHGTGPILKTKNADYCIDDTTEGFSLETASPIEIKNVKNILATPSITYQFYDGSGFQNVVVSRYLFLIKQNSVVLVKLPGALKWINNLTINQYTAMSTGGLGYKQG